MTVDLLVELAWKSLVAAGAALIVLRLMERRSAAEKSFVGHVGLIALLLLPLGMIGLPAMEVAAPAALADAIAPASPAPLASVSTPPPAAAPIDWAGLALWAYALPAAALLLLTLVAVVRLGRLRSRATMLVDAGWLTALASAQQRFGFKQGTALLASDDLESPVSWGMLRPTIVLDPATAARPAAAEAIIAHELAHVARLDWLKLLAGRVVVALFWFNPLVWVLARRCHHHREEAADDAVLGSAIPSADYAQLLIGAARHAHRGTLLAANGVAPGRTSLSLRVAGVLDPNRPRTPARLGWAAAAFLGAMGVNGALAAAEPIFGSSDRLAGARAADALGRLPGPHMAALSGAMRRSDWSARKPGSAKPLFHEPRAVAPLLAALRDRDPDVRRLAVWGLSEMRPAVGDAAGADVARLLGDPAPQVRAQAARALGDFGMADAAGPVAALLRDPDPVVRLEAAHALGDLQSPAAAAALESARDDPDPAVRAKAAWALRQVRETEAILRRYGS